MLSLFFTSLVLDPKLRLDSTMKEALLEGVDRVFGELLPRGDAA
jgi:hypothetical protein